MGAKSRITTCALCLMALLALCPPTHADYHYASHEGTNEYPYTSWETAAQLIQDAVDAASPHDTVYVGTGEWYETVATGVYDSVAIIGMGIDSTFWYDDTYHVPVLTIDYKCSVEGITFQDLDGWKCIEARAYAGVTIVNCKFLNTSIAVMSSGDSEISNCIFDSCGTALSMPLWSGNYLISNNLLLNCFDDYAMMLQVEFALVQNNIIINSPGVPITSIGGAPYGATMRNNVAVNGESGFGTHCMLKYNNLAKNFNNNTVSRGFGAGNSNLLYNNVAMGCRRGIRLLLEDSTCYINYNAFRNNGIDIEPLGHDFDSIGNIFCNPMLISDDDFHLQAYSPLIDAGDPNYLDFDGSRSDIGAYGGPFGESYIYHDLPPAIPDSISGEFVQDTIFINWRYNTEADFSNYLLYKDTVSGFEPSIPIAYPDTSCYIDTAVSNGHNYYYKIASIDNQNNVSDYSEELEVITTDIWGQTGATLPQITSIKANYPNPFNISTTIVYFVANLGPIPAEIEINIYDITGRKVRTLINERRDIGEHIVVWDGRDDSGNDCSTGVYFARISQWGLEVSGKPRKLVLIK